MLSITTVKTILLINSDKFFTVEFIKKDGTTRKMNGRFGVTKHLKGGVSLNSTPTSLVMYDVQARGYQTINLDKVKQINMKNGSLKLA
jgi:hypothetical protein